MLLIDTATVSPTDRLDFWSESSHDAYLPVQVRSPTREQFGARLWGYELGPLSLFRIAAAPNTMMRGASAITACDPECLHLSVVLRGQINAAQEGRTGMARVGDLISYETSHPVVFRADQPYESLVIRVPRHLLGRQEEEISRLTAVGIPGTDGLPKAAVAFICGLVGRLEAGTITPSDAPNTIECVLDLVRALYSAPRTDDAPRMRTRAEILLNVQSFIELNLGDPELDPERIARATFISTRYLHKLFEAEGTSVCRWIRETRLERCRHDLMDPAMSEETILAVASKWGLPGPEHFSRLFRSAYGCSPSELRREAKASRSVIPLR
jgi:AraC-like DNA-binding protein